MSVTIKSQREIEYMREAGRLLAIVHNELEKFVKPGVSTKDVDRLGEKIIRGFGCIPSFLNYQGYPASICVSVNEEIVHGIPSDNRILKDGDIVSLDAGLIYKGYHSDAARTHGVGNISDEAQRLIDVTRQCFFDGIQQAKAGNHLNDICKAIGNCATKAGYGIVKELVGHGIGQELHEAPQIPNYCMNRRGIKLESCMTLAIEPMITAGGADVKWLPDRWTVVTKDKSLAAHYENTVLITDGQPEILTLLSEESR